MKGLARWACVAVLIAPMSLPVAASADRIGPKTAASPTMPVVSIENAYIKIVVVADGSVVLGTTGGDPDIAGDEDKPLLFGYPAGSVTGYPSLRVASAGTTHDYVLIETPRCSGPSLENGIIVTRWLVGDLQVTQCILLYLNPYSGQHDMALMAYGLRNLGPEPLDGGIRCLLDVAVGENDLAPFTLPGAGSLAVEREFSSADMPGFLYAFESLAHAPTSLRAQGILMGFGLSVPDRVALATWHSSRGGGAGIYGTAWDYAVTPGASLGDSTVAYWWGPHRLDPGQERIFQTAYGLGKSGGGEIWLDAPGWLVCPDTQFTAMLWVSNLSG